jgi:GAF domain-containing protein
MMMDALSILNTHNTHQARLDALLALAVRIAGARAAVLYRIDTRRMVHEPLTSQGMPVAFQKIDVLPLFDPEAHKAIVTQMTHVQPDLEARMQELSDRFPAMPPAVRHALEALSGTFGAQVAVPVMVRQALIGPLIFYFDGPREFEEGDLEQMKIAAGVFGIELERENLAGEARGRIRELSALYRVDAELYQRRKLEEVLDALVGVAIDVMGSDKCSVMLWDERKQRLEVATSRGFHPDTIARMSWPPGYGVASHVLVSGEPAIVPDTHLDERVVRSVADPEGIRAFIHVPIHVEGKVIGVFNINYLQPRPIQEDERRLAVALAQRASYAFENARLNQQLEADRKNLHDFLDLAVRVEQPGQVQAILAMAAQGLQALCGAEQVQVFLVDELRELLVWCAGHPEPPQSPDVIKEFPLEKDAFLYEVYRTRKLHLCENTDAGNCLDCGLGKKLAAGAFAALPFCLGERVSALALICAPNTAEMTPDRLVLAGGIAGVAALAIQTAAAATRGDQQSAALKSLLAVYHAMFKEMRPEATLAMIVENARQVLAAKQALLAVRDEKGLAVVMTSEAGRQISDDVYLELGPAQVRMAMTTGRPFRTQKAALRKQDGTSEPLGECFVAPVLVGKQVSGMLCAAGLVRDPLIVDDELIFTLLAISTGPCLATLKDSLPGPGEA